MGMFTIKRLERGVRVDNCTLIRRLAQPFGMIIFNIIMKKRRKAGGKKKRKEKAGGKKEERGRDT